MNVSMTKDSIDCSLLDDAIRGVRDGDRAAFELIVRQFERPLRAWLATRAPPGLDVDDVAQRSFITAYTRIGDFEQGTSFSAWLFTLARFELRSETIRLRRVADYRTRYGPDLLQRELDRHGSEPPEMWATRMDCLRACLETLGEHVRCFVVWRYDEGIPLEEMATRSGRSVTAVKKQLWLVRKKLYLCIETRMEAAEGGPS